MPSFQDSIDAMGYFHLALAAALEDEESLQDQYIIYMKLAEIHANHLINVELSQRYMDSAQSLKQKLAGNVDCSHPKYLNYTNPGCPDPNSIHHCNAEIENSHFSKESSSSNMDITQTTTTKKEIGTVLTGSRHKEGTDTWNSEDDIFESGDPELMSQNNQRIQTSQTNTSFLCTEF